MTEGGIFDEVLEVMEEYTKYAGFFDGDLLFLLSYLGRQEKKGYESTSFLAKGYIRATKSFDTKEFIKWLKERRRECTK